MKSNFKHTVLHILSVLLFAVISSVFSFEKVSASQNNYEYEDMIFDDSYLHIIDIEIDEEAWKQTTTHAREENYVSCDVNLDGDKFENVGIRPMGNSSLKAIQDAGSDRFSLKIKFNCYDDNTFYYGLDKLTLNNLGCDPTCMKNYLAYHMMNDMNVPAPLSSYALIRINGEDHHLALCVEAVDKSFAKRTLGDKHGELYKPDVFSIDIVKPSNFIKKEMTDVFAKKEGFRKDILGSIINVAFTDYEDSVNVSAGKYVGDDKDDYDVIFDKSVFKASKKDKKKYIAAVKGLNDPSKDPGDYIFTEYVIPYFAVHNFVNNYDGYTGYFVHNFYLIEKDSKLAMVPWDYNLAFGAFSVESAYKFFSDGFTDKPIDTGAKLSSDESYVNYPIDTPCYFVSEKDRPMFGAWINNAKYKEEYHDVFRQFLTMYFEDGKYDEETQKVRDLIFPYVEEGMTFYSTTQFEEAGINLDKYCNLRYQSIKGQLDGTIPSTLKGQEQAPDTLIKTGDLDLSKTIDFNGIFGYKSSDIQRTLTIITIIGIFLVIFIVIVIIYNVKRKRKSGERNGA